MRLSDIRIRDPFLLSVPQEGWYYLFGSTDANTWDGPGTGFECYRSEDLGDWTGPLVAFRPPPGFWGTRQFWAPEVHPYAGAWFMLATFTGESDDLEAPLKRGTAVLRADHPQGPYTPWSNGPVTPTGEACLDGTLHVDLQGDPWLVYCREWTEVGDGQVVAQRLRADLRATLGARHVLFSASSAPWTRPLSPSDPGAGPGVGQAWVTDGPFLYRPAPGIPGSAGGSGDPDLSRSPGAGEGPLVMVWSSYGATGYGVGTATSASGSVLGPWTHDPQPLWPWDGGHAMVSRDLDGHLRLVLHQPNTLGAERTQLVDLIEAQGSVQLAPLAPPPSGTQRSLATAAPADHAAPQQDPQPALG